MRLHVTIFSLLLVLLVVMMYPFTLGASKGEVIEHCGILATDETWVSSVTHVVTCDIEVAPNATLTVEPGAVVKFQFRRSLRVRGTLVAIGNQTNSIYFTSYVDDTVGGDTNGDGSASVPGLGDWGHLFFYPESNDASAIVYTSLSYSGEIACCSANQGAIQLDNASPTLENISFHQNYINGAQILGNRTWATDTWDSTSVVYVLEGGDVTIGQGETLNVEPGVKIKVTFRTDLQVNGKLVMSGTIDSPISMTSYLDDSICGIGAQGEAVCDTHNDGGTAGSVGDWGHIQFNSSSDDESLLTRTIIKHSGESECCSPLYGAIQLDNASPKLSYLSLTDNYINGAKVTTTIDWLTSDWQNDTVIYVIQSGDLRIPALNSLTLRPGVKVKFEFRADMMIDGTLDAQGTEGNPIYFTSISDDTVCGTGALNEPVCDTNNNGGSTGGVGAWGHIQFNSNSNDNSIITRAVIRYSGESECCSPSEGALLLDNASPHLSYISFTNNYINGVELKGNINWTEDSWDNPTVVYVIDGGTLMVPYLNTLTVSAGTILKMNRYAHLQVDGKVLMEGTSSQPVWISSVYDDLLCGVGALNEPVCDTYNDGGSAGTRGDWGSIVFTANSDDSSRIAYTHIEYSGKRDCCSPDDVALILDNASPTIAYSSVHNGHIGIRTVGNSYPTLLCNDIFDNTGLGIQNLSTQGTIQAENHWWGDTSGPTHATNPNGTGQLVGDAVDFLPWRQMLCLADAPDLSISLFLPLVRR